VQVVDNVVEHPVVSRGLKCLGVQAGQTLTGK
jgi:hypothetical protein